MAMTKPNSSQVVHAETTVGRMLDTLNRGGATLQRPTNPPLYTTYFDTTLNKPIWKAADGWVDADGTSV